MSKLILRGSIETFGIREIADSAEVSVGTLTHYFGCKEDFYDALITRAGERTNWHLREAITKAKTKKQRLEKIFDHILKYEDEVLVQFLIILDAARARVPKEREKRAKKQRSEQIYLEILVRECAVRHDQARFFITNIIGMLTRRLWTGKSEDEQPQFKLLLKSLGI
ncbi:MAG: TetR/AcrR family transcriptional regulator [Pseudobdellovibrionaceae bacterium]